MVHRDLFSIVVRARDMLAKPDCWTSRHIAEDDAGRWVPVGSARAVRFSLQGALVKAAGPRAREAMSAAETLLGRSFAALYSPAHSIPSAVAHGEALSLLDAAAAHLLANDRAESHRSGIRLRAAKVPETSRGRVRGNGCDE